MRDDRICMGHKATPHDILATATPKTRITGNHSRPLKPPLFPLLVLINRQDPSLLRRPFALLPLPLFHIQTHVAARARISIRVPRELPTSVDEVLKLTRTELCTLDAEDERDGVHEVGLSGSVGTDDGAEVTERAYDLVAAEQFSCEDLFVRHASGRDAVGERALPV